MLGDKVLVRLVNLLPTSLAAQGQYVNTWRVQYKVGVATWFISSLVSRGVLSESRFASIYAGRAKYASILGLKPPFRDRRL